MRGGIKQSCPKNKGRMTVRLGGLGPWVYSIHPRTSVGLGLREMPWKKTPFRQLFEIRWMFLLARDMNAFLSWRKPSGPPDGQVAVFPD